jgi:hypothetical protein
VHYEIETNNLAETVCELKAKDGRDDSCVQARFFEPVGPSVSAALKGTKG